MTREPVDREVLLAEYSALKTEQNARIGTRDGLLYATFAAVGGVLVGAFTSKLMLAMLVAPPVILVLGWTYLSNDIKVSQLGSYVRDILAPKLGEHAFGWELDTEVEAERRTRKLFQLAADLIAFPAASVALALAGLLLGPYSLLALFAAMAEAAASIALGVMFVRYAETGRQGPDCSIQALLLSLMP
jgi:hypothetical protein